MATQASESLNRIPQIEHTPPIIPVSKSQWWKGVREGKYPAPMKLSARCTVWDAEAIWALVDQLFPDKSNQRVDDPRMPRAGLLRLVQIIGSERARQRKKAA